MRVHLQVDSAPTNIRDTAVGTPQECADQVRRRFGARAGDICCYFPGYQPSDSDVAELVSELHRISAPQQPV